MFVTYTDILKIGKGSLDGIFLLPFTSSRGHRIISTPSYDIIQFRKSTISKHGSVLLMMVGDPPRSLTAVVETIPTAMTIRNADTMSIVEFLPRDAPRTSEFIPRIAIISLTLR